jgi:NhaP-type Na+/H+ and K+/H+ antiporter
MLTPEFLSVVISSMLISAVLIVFIRSLWVWPVVIAANLAWFVILFLTVPGLKPTNPGFGLALALAVVELKATGSWRRKRGKG